MHFFLALFFYILTLVNYIRCQRYVPQIPGIRTIDKSSCIARVEVDTDVLKFRFIKTDGAVFLYLSMKDFEAFQKATGEGCWPIGESIAWHIHERSRFGAVGIGNTQCSADNVGGHIDPTLACGPSSGNEICKLLKIPSSSVLGMNGSYQCTPELYQKSEYTCEIGDLAGKYGFLKIPDFKTKPTHAIALYASDYHDTIHSCELDRKSIVLHCVDNKKAFCARLSLDSSPQTGQIEAAVYHAGAEINSYQQYQSSSYIKY